MYLNDRKSPYYANKLLSKKGLIIVLTKTLMFGMFCSDRPFIIGALDYWRLIGMENILKIIPCALKGYL